MRSSGDFQVFSARRGRPRRHPQVLRPFAEDVWNRVLAASAGKVLGHPRRIAVAGIHEGAGSSTVAAALCHFLARDLGLHCLLVETDLRSPTAQRAGLAPGDCLGLRGLLAGKCDAAQVVFRVEPLGFHLLPAGEPMLNPTAVLTEETLAHVCDKLGSQFDVVVLDAPPLNAAPEDRAIVSTAESTVLVLRSGRTLPEQAAYWVGKLGEYGGTVGAVCLNFVRAGLPGPLRSLF